jgi:hypothetical protein
MQRHYLYHKPFLSVLLGDGASNRMEQRWKLLPHDLTLSTSVFTMVNTVTEIYEKIFSKY